MKRGQSFAIEDGRGLTKRQITPLRTAPQPAEDGLYAWGLPSLRQIDPAPTPAWPLL
jgi:hypothetical protein